MLERPKIDNNGSCTWETYGDLLINQGLFKKGLVVVRSNTPFEGEALEITKTQFRIKERHLFFNLNQSTEKLRHSKERIRAAKKTKSLLLQINPNLNNDICIFNSRHREEVFHPFIVGDEKAIGFYIYPWAGKASEFIFSGFNNFITAGCMFGANLKAIDEVGDTYPLVRHDNFSCNLKIKQIIFNQESGNPYEDTLFYELKKLTVLIKNYSKTDQAPKLIYHLPYYDYVLFGIKLFINAAITYEELDKLISLIFIKTDHYQKKIRTICNLAGIDVSIQSPFDNLFDANTRADNSTKSILESLNLLDDLTFYSSLTEEAKIEFEADLVKTCLTKLRSNDSNILHRIIWSDFLNMPHNQTILNFESLFKLANSVMIGVASRNNKDNETCSLLPLTEKQIQVHYSSIMTNNCNAENGSDNLYPAVFNMTILDSVIAYSSNNDGLLFYLDSYQDTLFDLIANQRLLENANENMVHFMRK